jgi:hypothetical protein
MRHSLSKTTALIWTITMLVCALEAQEGIPYIGTKEVHERACEVHQSHGRNVLNLSTISTGYYDADGNIIDQVIQKGNKTHLGRRVQNISKDPETKEILEFNHMNLLSSRSVEIAGEKTGETTHIEYDAKGKITKKQSTRLSLAKSELWTMDYNQVGYVHRYAQSIDDDSPKLMQQKVFDYSDELIEIHNHLYDEDDRLIAIIAVNPQDSILFKQEFRYDYIGNLIEEKYIESEDTLIKSIRYSYDDKNRMTQRSEFAWNPRFGVVPQLKKQSDFSYR